MNAEQQRRYEELLQKALNGEDTPEESDERLLLWYSQPDQQLLLNHLEIKPEHCWGPNKQAWARRKGE
jgi:hypothetical protein